MYRATDDKEEELKPRDEESHHLVNGIFPWFGRELWKVKDKSENSPAERGPMRENKGCGVGTTNGGWGRHSGRERQRANGGREHLASR